MKKIGDILASIITALTDMFTLSKHVILDELKYLFTMLDYFLIYKWIVPLNYKTTKYTRYIQKCTTTFNVLPTLQTDNVTEFGNSIINQFCNERNIQHILEIIIAFKSKVVYNCLKDSWSYFFYISWGPPKWLK